MSKPASGLFTNTSIVWAHIKSTQDCYSGTKLPQSFEIATPAGKVWTHGNATEHIYEAILSIKADPAIKNSNPNMYTQFILYDYWKSLGTAIGKEIKYETKITQGQWEFILAKPRGEGKFPMVKHAKFNGLK